MNGNEVLILALGTVTPSSEATVTTISNFRGRLHPDLQASVRIFCKAPRRGGFRAIPSRKRTGDLQSQAAEALHGDPSFSFIPQMGELRLIQRKGPVKSGSVCSDNAARSFLPSLPIQELP